MLTECLKGAGFDVSRLQGTTPYSTGSAILAHRHSWVEAGVRGSSSDLNSFQIEVDSENSSPGVQRVCNIHELLILYDLIKSTLFFLLTFILSMIYLKLE